MTERSYYPATCGVVVLILALALGLRAGKGLIPPPPENALADSNEPFLLAASRQPVRWRGLSAEVWAEARRRNKVVMMVLGSASSRSGRLFDSTIFDDPNTASRINLDFIAIRVDTDLHPWSRRMVAPLSRSIMLGDPNTRIPTGFDPDFQIWFFSARRELIGGMPVSISGAPPRLTDMGKKIRQILNYRERIVQVFEGETQPGEEQRREYEVLSNGGGVGSIDVQDHIDFLNKKFSTDGARWSTGTANRINPSSLLLMVRHGERDLFERAIGTELERSAFDWISGESMPSSRDTGWNMPDFDSRLVHTASMMEVLAEAGNRFGNPIWNQMAKRSEAFLAEQLAQKAGPALIRIGDEIRENRSDSRSFGPTRLSRMQGINEPVFIRELNLNRSPIHLVFPKNGIPNEALSVAVAEAAKKPMAYRLNDDCENEGLIGAAIIRANRVLSDKQDSAKILSIYERMKRFRVGLNDVRRHAVKPSESAYLGDYLAYAELAAEAGNAGVPGAREEAKLVFLRAIDLFESPTPGALKMILGPEAKALPKDTNIAGIVDYDSPALMARAIKVARMLKGEPTIDRFRTNVIQLYSPIVGEIQQNMSGIVLEATAK